MVYKALCDTVASSADDNAADGKIGSVVSLNMSVSVVHRLFDGRCTG